MNLNKSIKPNKSNKDKATNEDKSTNEDKATNINDYIKFINQTQKDIVMDESRLILINGCAGSRKTDTLIKKGINYIISNKKNILFLTFVSSVSNEIKNRIEQTLNIQIPKIGSSNHFLSQYNSNYIEIANIDAWIHKQITWIETNIINDEKYKNNSNEFDKFIEDKIKNLKDKKDPINFNSRVILLKNYTDIYKFYNIILKNDKFTDVILIDEFQDTDIEKVELIIMLVKNNPNLFCVVAGDILQTIFVNNIGCKNFINPINYFKNKLEPKYYEINTCFRCPAAHINFVNYLLGEKYKKYGLDLMVPQNNDEINKPVLFGHDCISKNDTSYKLAQSISNTIINIIKFDKTIKPDDIVIMMKKSNSNFVFDHIKNILPDLYKKNNICINTNVIIEDVKDANNVIKNSNTQLIHFETSGDGYSNSINWDKALNKTVLISIHGDKGKGHKVVFFLGLSKKSIPSDYNIGKDFELIDISLLNVALTRSLKYLFIGFTFISPSVYLSSKHMEFNKYCYLAWDKNIHNQLATPEYNVYLKSILELNKYWFDNLKPKLKNPNFVNTYNPECQLLTNKLPIKSSLKVSQDISKDMVGFIELIIPDLVVEKDYIDFYQNVKMDEIPEPFYKIFGFVGELLLMRFNMIQTNNFGIFGWILNSSIMYTDSDMLLNVVYDYKLNHHINDTSLWKEKVIEIELVSILENKNLDIIYLIQNLETNTKPQFVLNKFYQKFQIHQYIQDFCSSMLENKQLYSHDVEKIILIAMIYAEHNCEIRRDYIYALYEQILNLENIKKIIGQIILNTQYVWDNYINSVDNVEFQKNISIEKKITNKNILKYYGFNYKTDKNIFSKGFKLAIGGICDLIVEKTNGETNLFELKTCLKTSFSNEWVLQIAVYNLLINLVNKTKIKSNYIINLFDGVIYEIKFNPDIQILKNILKLYDFDDYLLNFILE